MTRDDYPPRLSPNQRFLLLAVRRPPEPRELGPGWLVGSIIAASLVVGFLVGWVVKV
jgi:hypothetical protein